LRARDPDAGRIATSQCLDVLQCDSFSGVSAPVDSSLTKVFPRLEVVCQPNSRRDPPAPRAAPQKSARLQNRSRRTRRGDARSAERHSRLNRLRGARLRVPSLLVLGGIEIERTTHLPIHGEQGAQIRCQAAPGFDEMDRPVLTARRGGGDAERRLEALERSGVGCSGADGRRDDHSTKDGEGAQHVRLRQTQWSVDESGLIRCVMPSNTTATQNTIT